MQETKKLGNKFISLSSSKNTINIIFNRLKSAHKNKWSKRFSLQVTHNKIKNAIILVSPDGKFYTESNLSNFGKILIDEEKPTNPDIEKIHKKIALEAHAKRYLNIED